MRSKSDPATARGPLPLRLGTAPTLARLQPGAAPTGGPCGAQAAALLLAAGLCDRARGDFRSAQRLLTQALALAPSSFEALSNRGYCHRKLGDFAAAVADYTAAAAQEPRSARLYNNRAYCHARLGEFREAVADYSTVLDLEPDNVRARLYLVPRGACLSRMLLDIAYPARSAHGGR